MIESGDDATKGVNGNVKIGVHEWRLKELEAGVRDIKGTLAEINGKIDRLPCPRHDAELSSIRADALSAQKILATAATTARETVSDHEVEIRKIMAVSAAIAKQTVDDAAAAALAKVKAAGDFSRSQQHWLIERITPVVYSLIAAGAGYWLASLK